MIEELWEIFGELNGLKINHRGIVIKVPYNAYHLDYDLCISQSKVKYLDNIPEKDHIILINMHKIEVLKTIWDDVNRI